MRIEQLLRRETMQPPRPLVRLTVAEVTARYAAGQRNFSRLDLRSDDPPRPFRITHDPADQVRLGGMGLPGANFYDSSLDYIDATGTDLSECDWSYSDLRYVDFTGAKISLGIFRGARMQGAILRDVEAFNTDFSNAELYYGDATGAYLEGSWFPNAKLFEARFDSARIAGGIFSGANAVCTSFCSATITDGFMDHMQLARAQFDDADVGGTTFAFSRMVGVDVSVARNVDKTMLPEFAH